MAMIGPATDPRAATTGRGPVTVRSVAPHLMVLRDRMNRAHDSLLTARRGADPRQVLAARGEQLRAMTEYEDALVSCRLPVPPRLRRDIGLLRRLERPFPRRS